MKDRIMLWDNLKFILITLVVVGHFAERFASTSDICKSIFLFIYAFHMPLFLFISGMFHKDTDIPKKILFYISAGFVLKFALSIANRLAGKEFSFQLLADSYIPWFMFALAAYTALCYLLRNENKIFILIGFILLACFTGYDETIGDLLYLSRIIVFFPFYLLGNILKPQAVNDFRKKYRWLIIPAILIMLVWAYCCFAQLETAYVLRRLFTGRNPFSEVFASNGILARLLCYMISALTCFSLIFLVPSGKIPFVSKAGQNTLNVYFWHWPLYILLDHYFNISVLFSYGLLGKAGFFLIAILLPICLSFLLFSFPLKQIRTAIYKPNTNQH